MTTGNLFDATEPLLGYLYQCRYALLLLIRRSHLDPSVQMSIERFDDIAFEENGSPTELIQTKHHIGQKRNLTDASPDLWKTVRVWCDGLRSGTLDLSSAVLAIVTTATAPAGSAASFLRTNARRDADAALKKLLCVAGTTNNKENKPAFDLFCGLTSEQQKALVGAIHVFDEAPDIHDVLPQIRAELVRATPRQHLDKMVRYLEGWWFETVVNHLRAGGGTVSGAALDSELDDLRERFQRDSLPLDFCFAEPPELPDSKKDQRTFVKQLRVIKCNEATISSAICDHYKSYGQRSQWVRENLVLDNDLGQYDRRLADEWTRRFARAQEDLGGDPTPDEEAKAGRSVYHDLQEKPLPIRPTCTEAVISRGSYQLLADEKRVGWHPRYDQLLGGGDSE